jgi:beta-lactamase regulating signal transducer with metallopeptidase domain
MNEWPSFLVERHAQIFALQVAIGGILVIALVLLAARVLRRRSAPLRYGVLFAGILGLLAVPAFVGVGQRFQDVLLESKAPKEETVKIPVEMLADFFAVSEPEAPLAAATAPWSETVGPMLLLAWALGGVVGLGRLVRAMRLQRRGLVGVPWHVTWWTDQRQAKLAQAVGLRQFPEVFSSPVAPMPLVLGLFRPTIVLPELAPASWGQSQWEAVLLHEAAHIARHDPWAALLQQLAVVLFWWCPLVYVLARRLNNLREQICDDYALQGACDGIAYAELLIESAERLIRVKAVPVPVGLLDSARGGLEDRITRLLQKEREPMTKLSLPGKLLGAAFLVTACLLITAASALSQGAAPPTQKKIQIKIIVDGKEVDLNDVQIQRILDAAPQKVQREKAPDGVIAPIDVAVQVKPDPRIEELVRQAEAIKPGSGVEVRRALQGKTAAEMKLLHDVLIQRGGAKPHPEKAALDKKIIVLSADGKILQMHTALPPTGAGAPPRFDNQQQDKKIIVLVIEGGKVTSLQGHDLKAFMEKDLFFNAKVPGPDMNWVAKPTMILPLQGGVPGREPSTTPVPPRVGGNDTEALLRQLERINAELQELRAKLHDTQKRQAK